MAKEWVAYTKQEKEEYINNLQELDDEKLIEYWNNYNGGNNYELTIYEVDDFDDNFLVADRHREKAIDNAPLNWKDYIYISLTGEVFDSIWEYSEFKQMIEEEGWNDFAQFIVECCIDEDEDTNDYLDDEKTEQLREEFVSEMLNIFHSARPICQKINMGIEANGVENDNLYYEPIEVIEGLLSNIANKLDDVELETMFRFATIIEANSVQQNGTPEQIENYINDKVEKITEVWENSLEEE
jgi:hypothetical protein